MRDYDYFYNRLKSVSNHLALMQTMQAIKKEDDFSTDELPILNKAVSAVRKELVNIPTSKSLSKYIQPIPTVDYSQKITYISIRSADAVNTPNMKINFDTNEVWL